MVQHLPVASYREVPSANVHVQNAKSEDVSEGVRGSAFSKRGCRFSPNWRWWMDLVDGPNGAARPVPSAKTAMCKSRRSSEVRGPASSFARKKKVCVDGSMGG